VLVVRFSKYQALGNDFVVVDLREGAEPVPSPQAPHVVQALCDRRRGVGADGVLLVMPPSSGEADARMRTLNADGSEAEMCGNGLRCVAAFLANDQAPTSSLLVDTGAGPLSCTVERGPGGLDAVTVELGPPGLLHPEIPMEGPEHQRCVDATLEVEGVALAITAVAIGNPHAVTFSEAAGDELRGEAETLGPSVEVHPRFPQRTNAGFARAISRTELELFVWERGVGLTPACGTGACAAAVAACLGGLAEPGEEITVHQAGGSLAITVAPQCSGLRMRGPARHVYDGHIDLAALL
jgi:diaminopimelate epimerase